MTATTGLDRRADYVSAVAVELADLAPDDRAELIEELDDHIAALLEDRPEVDLAAELGTPRAYAAELRSAAGLTGGAAVSLTFPQRWRAFTARVDARAPWLRPLLHTLRPVWWVLRGVLVGSAVGMLLGFSSRSVQGLALLALAVAGSVWIAQRPNPSRNLRRGILALDAASVVVLAWLAVWVGPLAGSGYAEVRYDTQYVPNCPIELSNLYAYDAAGKPVDGVRLFDQNGNPFDLSVFGCNAGLTTPGSGGVNSYPWPSYDEQQPVEPTGPPASLAPLPGATVSDATVSVTPNPTPSGSASATPTPSGSATSTPTP